MVALQDNALLLLLLLGQESRTRGVLKDLSDALVCLCRTLEILVGPNLLANLLTLFRGDGLLASLVQFFNSLLVVTEILFATDENDRQALAEVKDFRDPLLLDIVQRIWGVHSETDQDDVGVRI